MISEEIRHQLETDLTFLQASALAVVRSMNRVFGISQEKLAVDLEVSFVTVNRWVTGRHPPKRRSCRAIIRLAERQNLPVEAIILGKDLTQFADVSKSLGPIISQSELMISQEVFDRLRSDESFFQTCAAVLVREMVQVFEFKLDGVASDLGVPIEKLVQWVADRSLPNQEESWAALQLASKRYYMPVEAIIQGKVLGQHDPAKKVSCMRLFITAALDRIEKDSHVGEKGEQKVALVVESGKLSLFDLGSWPGACKISLTLTMEGEELVASYWRINQDEETIGGISLGYRLPCSPEALNVKTLPVYDPQSNRYGTIRDWIEMIRWVIDSEVVDPNYHWECYERYLRKELRLHSVLAAV